MLLHRATAVMVLRYRFSSDTNTLLQVSHAICTPRSKIANKISGLFMGLFAGSILLSILYVAISAVSSLEVSYASFDKENGPAAQKKLF